MNFSHMPDFDDHEEVRVFDLDQSGAKAIIAIHSTYRGPAFGGCRVWRYDDMGAAVTDALRLSRGMSYKNAMADLPLGGGKAVIMLPPGDVDRRALFEAFGRAIESLGGRYTTAEDVGSTVADMQVVATQTANVGGLPALHTGQAGGDPSPWTALGVFAGVKAALDWRFGLGVSGARVTVQGVGAVGGDLARRLVEAGAVVTVADIDRVRAQRVAEELDARVVEVAEIHRVQADVFAPCALGGVLNAGTIPDLGAPIICGAANNQLADPKAGQALRERGVLYCPDYLVNAGGIIAVQGEMAGAPSDAIEPNVMKVADRLVDILQTAKDLSEGPETVTDAAARARIGRGAGRAFTRDVALAAAFSAG
jgi:leucine dehydrogenase